MLGLDISSFIISSIAVLSAGIIQILTGFGFALVSIPLLMFVFPGYEAVLIGMILSSIMLSLQAIKDWRLARWDLIGRLIAIGLLGIFLGVMVSGKLNAVHLKSIVGATVLIYVIIQWIQIEKNRRSGKREQAATIDHGTKIHESCETKKKKLPKGFYIAGAFSGLLTGVVGMPGPPVVAVLVHFLKKETFRATLVNYFLVNFLIALFLALFVFHKGNQLNVLFAVAVLIIPTFVGNLIGYPLRKFINDENFKRVVFSMLIIIGITSIWQSIF